MIVLLLTRLAGPSMSYLWVSRLDVRDPDKLGHVQWALQMKRYLEAMPHEEEKELRT